MGDIFNIFTTTGAIPGNGYLLTQTAVDLVWYDPVRPPKTIITSCRSAIGTPGVSIRFDIFLLFFS